MLKAFLATILLLTPNLAVGASDQPRRITPADSHQAVNKPGALSQGQAIIIRAKCCAYALKYNTKPAYIMAVAHVESRLRELEFRTWQTGKYYQPMGIQSGQYEKFARMGMLIDTLDGNIEVGARAFAGIKTLAAFKKRLKTYNSSFDQEYWTAICKAIKKYEKGVSL